VTRDDYLAQLASLLPEGPALPREPDSRLMRLLRMPAAELAAVDARGDVLLAEADPRVTAELLPEWEAAFGLPDSCSPARTFSRASRATWFDGQGTLREAAVNEERPEFDAAGQPTGGTIIEPASVNVVANPRAEGAVAGTPGTAPTGWAFPGTTNGIAREVVGTGVINGMPYVDVRFVGTTTAGPFGFGIFFVAAANQVPAAAGQAWTMSVWLALAGGSLANLGTSRLGIEGTNGALRTELLGGSSFVPLLDGSLRRLSVPVTLAVAGTTHIRPLLDLTFAAAGLAVDFTLRIALPQAEPGAVATSIILPPVGAPAASARAADVLTVATLAERRAAVLARMLGGAGQSRAYFVALAATLGYPGATVEEFRMPRAGMMAAGDPVHGYDWSQTWVLRTAATATRFAVAGEMAAGDPLTSFGDGRIECAVRRAAPAQTLPLFANGA
jgi:uncharacterized protein YmfQ (DUF2313 family)